MSDDSSSDAERAVILSKASKAPKKEVPKKGASKTPKIPSDSDDDDEEEEVKAPAKAPAAKGIVDSDGEEEDDVKVGPAKTQNAEEDSDSDVADAVANKAAQKTKVVEPEEESDDDDVEDAPTIKIMEKTRVVQPEDSDDSDDGAPEEEPTEHKNITATMKDEGVVQIGKQKAKLEARGGKAIVGSEKGQEGTDALRVFVQGLPFKITEDDLRKDFARCGPINNVKVLEKNGKSQGIAYITFKTTEGVASALKMDGSSKKYHGRTLKIVIADRAPQNKTPQSKEEKKKEKGRHNEGKTQIKDEPSAAKSSADQIVNDKLVKKMIKMEANCDYNALASIAAKITRKAQQAQAAKLAKKEQESRRQERREKAPEFAVFIKGLPRADFTQEAFQRRFEDCGSIKYVWLPLNANGEPKGHGKIAFKTEDAVKKAMAYSGTKAKGSVITVARASSNDEKPKQGLASAEAMKRIKTDKVEESSAVPSTGEQCERGKKQKRKALTIDATTTDAAPLPKTKKECSEPVAEDEPASSSKEKRKKRNAEESLPEAEEKPRKKNKIALK